MVCLADRLIGVDGSKVQYIGGVVRVHSLIALSISFLDQFLSKF
jgi:hypothetical protein